jgi:2-keto-4-pentenoate hydratase/2-oxohepta-3-ene-1,7-dioic acid hydratase in catechol pathway
MTPFEKRPGKVVCVGRNYRAHAAELGNAVPSEPLLFLKPPSAIIGPNEPIVIPSVTQRVEHEGEIGVIVSKTLRKVGTEQAAAAVGGIVCVNDVTARDLQRQDSQWTRAKGFDTFCPVGPRVVEVDQWNALSDIEVICRVNGEERQRGVAADMVFDIPRVLSYISFIMTLEPGDLVSTGSPEGVGPLVPGDRVEVEIPGVGVLSNPVEADSAS